MAIGFACQNMELGLGIEVIDFISLMQTDRKFRKMKKWHRRVSVNGTRTHTHKLKTVNGEWIDLHLSKFNN